MRLRFAPSPTGPLHIGGLRTALYNYLLAKKNNGTFILRIEDTDQKRYVSGAEQYIKEALAWCHISPDEGTEQGGEYGPYRQSERQKTYQGYAQELVESGRAYLAFDTPEELEKLRSKSTSNGKGSLKYDASTRMTLRNSLALDALEIKSLKQKNTPFVIRLKVDPNRMVTFNDEVRGEVTFNSSELDDKVLLKADGHPTYHLANVVDDHLMKITHVIRGEEWLSSTAHHVLLYEAFEWTDSMPLFAHLPLILKPTGKGKLSKRDGAKLGIPVFPLEWKDEKSGEIYSGFREMGFSPDALINFLAFLGWNPGDDREIFSLNQLVESFSLDRIVKSGARFDYEKALWYNQQYIQKMAPSELASIIHTRFEKANLNIDKDNTLSITELLKSRASTFEQFVEQAGIFSEAPTEYDHKTLEKRAKPQSIDQLSDIISLLGSIESFDAIQIEEAIKGYININSLKFGDIFPILRIGLTGKSKGPDLYKTIGILGLEETKTRLETLKELIVRN